MRSGSDSSTPLERTDPKVSYRLLDLWSDLLLCSHCLKGGVHRPVEQVISRRHRPRSLCSACHGRACEPSVVLEFP